MLDLHNICFLSYSINNQQARVEIPVLKKNIIFALILQDEI